MVGADFGSDQVLQNLGFDGKDYPDLFSFFPGTSFSASAVLLTPHIWYETDKKNGHITSTQETVTVT
jgi:hypothetical protein